MRSLHILLISSVVGLGTGCSRPLPEAGSIDAQLYVQYCSGSGCHTPIPPGQSTVAMWNLQYERMLTTMREARRALPSSDEEKRILAYLHRNAEGSR